MGQPSVEAAFSWLDFFNKLGAGIAGMAVALAVVVAAIYVYRLHHNKVIEPDRNDQQKVFDRGREFKRD